MTNKKTIKTTFNECILTGVVFDGRVTPLRLWFDDGVLLYDLSDRDKLGAIFLDPKKSLLNQVLAGKRQLPDGFQSNIPKDFLAKICCLYDKNIYKMLGFMLQSNQAVIGRRAIDRALVKNADNLPFALLQTSEGSDAICNNFLFKQNNLKVIRNFPQEILQKISGREKISYYCVLDTQMGKNFVNDYINYLQLCSE